MEIRGCDNEDMLLFKSLRTSVTHKNENSFGILCITQDYANYAHTHTAGQPELRLLNENFG